MMKRGVFVLGGMAAGLLLCWALIAHLGIRSEDWARLLRDMSWPWACGVASLSAFLWWSGAHKWALWARALHGEAGSEPAPKFFLRHCTWQSWFGLFLPPPVAVLVGRSWAARHMPGVGWRGGAGSAFYDQFMEFALLAGLLPAAVLVLYAHAGGTVWLPTAIAGMLAVGGGFWLFRARLPRGTEPFLPSLLLWSALRVLVTVTSYVIGAKALGLALDPLHIAAAAPVVALLFLIPVTPGNLGLAEWGWVGVLAYAGSNALDAGLFALGFRLLMVLVQNVLLLVNEALFFAANRRKC